MSNDTARDQDRVWQLMQEIGFAMLVTRDGDKLRARPMSAHIERENNAIFFLTDARRHKDDEIARNPAINLSFPRPEDHAQRCRILGFARYGHQLREDGGSRRRQHAARDRRESQSHDVMSIEPPEIPPATPGHPTVPPQESPPGNPRPEVPPPQRDPGDPPQPRELPGETPEELPIRGPNGPRTPSPATDPGADESGCLNAQ